LDCFVKGELRHNTSCYADINAGALLNSGEPLGRRGPAIAPHRSRARPTTRTKYTAPWAIQDAACKRQRRNEDVTEIVNVSERGHALTIGGKWRGVAETALAFTAGRGAKERLRS
jgi:hypothetical protein